jgi:hypothetical protein
MDPFHLEDVIDKLFKFLKKVEGIPIFRFWKMLK